MPPAATARAAPSAASGEGARMTATKRSSRRRVSAKGSIGGALISGVDTNPGGAVAQCPPRSPDGSRRTSMATVSRPVRFLLIVAGALVALMLVGWATLAILFPPTKVRAIAQKQLSSALTREVRFDGASVSIFPPVRLNVNGLALAEPGGFGKDRKSVV